MWSLTLNRLITTLFLLLLFPNFGYTQFSYQPKSTDLLFLYSDSIGWTITNRMGTDTIESFKNENAYIQLLGDEVKIYKMSENLWNTHPQPKFLDRIHIPYRQHQLPDNSAPTDYYSSFWVSASNGHIRVFKYPETISVKEKTFSNKNLGNHIFLNKNKKSAISSKNTIFMISPKGNIFEIDQKLKIWRFILTNRTLTPWTSEPPSEKMVFHIFKKEDFKKVIPLGKKDNKYLFQIIDHNNKVGIASLTTDYFQITYEVPTLFDFISPSLNNDFHLVYNNGKLGVLYFLPQESENQITEFKTVYTPAKHKLFCAGLKGNPQPLFADGNTFTVMKKTQRYTSSDFSSEMYFGIEQDSNDYIIYNEYAKDGTISNSGLYRISQNAWYIQPEKNYIKVYPKALLETQFKTTSSPITYSVYSKKGRPLTTNISNFESRNFFYLTSTILDVEMDTLAPLTGYDSETYKFRSLGEWGVIHIKEDKFQIVLPPEYVNIKRMGYKKSLVLTKKQSFDWYGIQYAPDKETSTSLVRNQAPLILYENNALKENSKASIVEAIRFNESYIYNFHVNSTPKAEVYSEHMELPKLTGEKVLPCSEFIWVIDSKSNTPNRLYNWNLKPIETKPFDSVIVDNDIVLLVDTHQSKKLNTPTGEKVLSYQIKEGFYKRKPIKSIKKYDEMYYQSKFLIARDNTEWIIIDPTHTKKIDGKFTTLFEASSLIHSLK